MYVYWQEYFQGQFQRQQVKSSYDLIAKSKTDRYFFHCKIMYVINLWLLFVFFCDLHVSLWL